MELIIVSDDRGKSIEELDLSRINSYLAIKYAIALERSNYFSGNRNMIWNMVKNTGYDKEIFGIGRDDATGLNQKQAHDSQHIYQVFVGSRLANLNVENTSQLNNENFILFGSNGAIDALEEYNYRPNDGNDFMEGALEKPINYRDANVLKVQLTSPAPTYQVRMKVDGMYLLVSDTDPTFRPENTRLIKVNQQTGYVDVTVKDGCYIGLAYFDDGPGGVGKGLRMWLSAKDKDLLKYNKTTGDIISWKDRTEVSNTEYEFINPVPGKSFAPVYSKANRITNFYPSVEFRNRGTSAGDYLSTYNAPASVESPKGFTTVHIIYQSEAKLSRNYFMGFGSTESNSGSRNPAFGLRPKNNKIAGRLFGDGGAVQGDKELSKIGATSININSFDKTTGRVHFEANGIYEDKIKSGLGKNFKMNGEGTLGAGSLTEAAMAGNMAEVLYYERVLTQAEIDKIYSSFAIKYGVTLRFENRAVGSNFDYTLSDQSSVWAGNTSGNFRTYYNNVAGIVRDDAAGLFNNISNSTDEESVVTMMIRGIESMEGQGDKPMLEEDLQYLFWGNDGAEGSRKFTSQQMLEFCTPAGERVNRVWMVRKAPNLDVAKVSILIQNSPEFVALKNIAQAGVRIHMFVADSPTKLANNQWDLAVPSTFLKYKGQQLEYDFTDEYTYFTLGIENVPGAGCDNCNYKTIQGINFDKSFQTTHWPNGTRDKQFSIGYDYDSIGNLFPLIATIKTDFLGNGNAQFTTYSPKLLQDKTVGNMLYLSRSGDANPTMRTTIETTSPGAAVFQIRGINRLSKLYSNVTISGFCDSEGAGTIFPKITPANGNNNLNTFTIDGNKVNSKRTPTTNTTNDKANRNVVNVKFNSPVKKIVIDQNISGANAGAQWMAIGDISYYCPAPIPPFNEAGLSMRMSVFPRDVIMCGKPTPVRYDIDVFNSNCNDKFITVSDTLPAKMYWDIDAIMIDQIAKEPGRTIIEVQDLTPGDKRILKITDLKIVGKNDPTDPFTFTVNAMFVKNALEGTYENQAWFEGDIVKNGVPIRTTPRPSADLVLGDGRKTPVSAIDGGMDLEPVVLANNDPGCYAENQEIPLRLVLTNPNIEEIGKLIIEAAYSNELDYVKNSLTINGVKVEPLFEKNNVGQNIRGYFYLAYDKFAQLAFKDGKVVIDFKMKVPDLDKLTPVTDANGKFLDWEGNASDTRFPKGRQAIEDIYLQFSADSKDENPCISASFDDAIKEFNIGYCRSKEYIISNKHVTNKMVD